MKSQHLNALLDLVRKKNALDTNSDWSNTSDTYLSEIKKEVDEVAEEIRLGRQCYLEDELGDVLWDYLNLLVSLEQEDKIVLGKVFERARTKYQQRIDGIASGKTWGEVKAEQKGALAREWHPNGE